MYTSFLLIIMKDTKHIEALTGVLVAGHVVSQTSYKLSFIGFGDSDYEFSGIVKNLEFNQHSFSVFPADLFEGEDGEKIKDMLDYAAVIFVLNETHLEPLRAKVGQPRASRVVDFTSTFGMSPVNFLTASPYSFNEIDFGDSWAVADEIASYLQSNLMEYYIFGPWMMYIKGNLS